MSTKAAKIKKEVRKDVRKLQPGQRESALPRKKNAVAKAIKAVERQYPKGSGKSARADTLARSLKGGTNAQSQAGEYFRRNFTKRDAARLAWMLCVADPFGSRPVPVPMVMAVGASASCPRMYSIRLAGFTSANSLGRCYIGLNADAWMANPLSPAGSMPTPYQLYLGNSSAYGSRGYPLHFTGSGYIGCPTVTGSSGLSWPASVINTGSGVVGLSFVQLPDNFIAVQTDGDPASGDAFQRFQCVSAGLRVRPVGLPGLNLVPSGVIMMTQQILGDVLLTNVVASSGTLVAGGPDVYGYQAGLSNIGGAAAAASVAPLAPDCVGQQEWDIAEWPRDPTGTSSSWLTAAAIPNQSCSFGQWTPGNNGNGSIGYPQVAAIVAGSVSGQKIEYEAQLVYAFYGAVSYEDNASEMTASVPVADLQQTVTSGLNHLSIAGKAASPAHAAVASVAQTEVDSGLVHPKAAASWINSGKDAIETATGSSIGDIIEEGLGFLAAALF